MFHKDSLTRLQIATVALIGALAWGVAHAETIDETRPLAANGAVSVRNVAGLVNVTVWDRNEVRIAGEIDGEEAKLDIGGSASSLSIEVKPLHKSQHSGAELILTVPAGAKLAVETVSSDVIVQGLKGALEVSTVSGDITLSVASGDVHVNTVSGDVQLSAPASSTQMKTVSGDLHVDGVRGELKLESVSGDMEVRTAALTSGGLKTVSGDIRLDTSLSDDAKLTGESLSGDIEVTLPKTTSAQMTLHAFSGGVSSDFATPVKSDEDDEQHSLDVKAGDGRAKVDLSTFSGEVTVRRK